MCYQRYHYLAVKIVSHERPIMLYDKRQCTSIDVPPQKSSSNASDRHCGVGRWRAGAEPQNEEVHRSCSSGASSALIRYVSIIPCEQQQTQSFRS